MNVPRILQIYFYEDQMIFVGSDFRTTIDLKKVSKKLLQATEIDRAVYSISATGYNVYWAKLDVNLSISTLLSRFGSPQLVEKMMKKKDKPSGFSG